MEHPVQIEGSLPRQQRNAAVDRKRDEHGDKVDLIGVDRVLHGIHLPDHVGIEGRGNDLQPPADGLRPAVGGQERVDDVRPVALHDDAAQRQHHAREERRPGALGVAEAAVQPEDHHGAAAAHPHHGHDRDEKVDVVQLGHEKTAAAVEDADPDGDDPQQPDVLGRRRRFFVERQDHVLRDGEAGAEDSCVVRRDHRKDHQQAEHPHDDGRQDTVHPRGHHQLVIERAVLLEF